MDLLTYIEKGGVIVYLLIALNIIGFTIIIWKFLTLPHKEKITYKILRKLNLAKNIDTQIEYEIKKLETGLNLIKNIASVAPFTGIVRNCGGSIKSL